MAISHVQGKAAVSSSVAFDSNVSAGSLVVVVCWWNDATSVISSIGTSGTASISFTVQYDGFTNNATRSGAAWGIVSSGGTLTVTCNLSGSPATVATVADEFSGIASSPYDTGSVVLRNNPGEGDDVIKATSITTAETGELIYAWVACRFYQAAVDVTEGTGFYVATEESTGYLFTEYLIQGSSGAITATADNPTGTGDDFAIGVMAFKAASSGGLSIPVAQSIYRRRR